MINSVCGSLGSQLSRDASTEASTCGSVKPQQHESSHQPPASVSISGSNTVDLSGGGGSVSLARVKTAVTLVDEEVQSPDWDVLLGDHLLAESGSANIAGSVGDFMVMSSPRRDYCFMHVSSPRRDLFVVSSPTRRGNLDTGDCIYMVSSPTRRADYMVSSPRRDYMAISSPRRDFMAVPSSSKSDYMPVSSPRRDFMVVSSPLRGSVDACNNLGLLYHESYFGHDPSYADNHLHRPFVSGAKLTSPLRKSISTNHETTGCSDPYQGEYYEPSLALPAIDELLAGDFFLKDNTIDQNGSAGLDICSSSVLSSTSADKAPLAIEDQANQILHPSLLECLSLRSPAESDPEARISSISVVGGGCQQEEQVHRGNDDGLCGPMNEFALLHAHEELALEDHQQQLQQQWRLQMQAEEELDESLLSLIGKSEQFEASYHGIRGSEVEDDSGLQLVHLLLACAEAVSKQDHDTARRHLHHLRSVVSPSGDTMQRVAACFTDALASRLTSATFSKPAATSSNSNNICKNKSDILKLYQILYQACPYVKFAHFTANQAIYEAFEGEDRVHVVDLDIHQGYQWPSFMHALAARQGGPPFLRITGVGPELDIVRQTGRHLADLARSLRVPFEYHPVVARLDFEDLQPNMLHRRVGEALAVCAVNRLHRVPANQIGRVLAMVRDQAPNVVAIVEQEANHNGPHFLGRFLEALHYYSAIFDSLDATFRPDSEARARVEQCLFGLEIQNIIAYEGPDRVERHERLEKWRRIMEGKGFKGVPLSSAAAAQCESLLGVYPAEGYRLTEDRGSLLLGWQDRPIVAASAWRC